ncbi:hypothetical protein VST7929_03090 [Vibrio stylophorae]|uniref:SDR family oxidoreductase n=1 Tax=Vibrio stylophorae TaxID=659351 RepID=A0ABM8ZXN7_9VIBR|nr:SDR family NAD(P)-dependent oxidoreductase [Vibrio stylophorae]CAH0535519.1 hypothetical protein VST7929_03090 [Vibrio stylophorae]
MQLLITAGTSAIGQALIAYYLANYDDYFISATYHRSRPKLSHPRLQWHPTDLSHEADVQQLASQFALLDGIINCAGFLHDEQQSPEKSLSQFQPEFFEQNIAANTLPTLLLAKHFASSLSHPSPSFFVSLSARIGSLADNKIGGWISYRMSKAALNMAIKTIAIEWQRILPCCCVLAIHPGTTKSRLTRPFERNVPAHQLHSPQQTAEAIVQVIYQKKAADSGQFVDYQGCVIPW